MFCYFLHNEEIYQEGLEGPWNTFYKQEIQDPRKVSGPCKDPWPDLKLKQRLPDLT